jgi:hypothetical protein
MADLGESIIKIWNSYVTQLPLPDHWSPYMNVIAAVIPVLGTMAFSIRRFRKVSSELADATKIINEETKGRLNSVPDYPASHAIFSSLRGRGVEWVAT